MEMAINNKYNPPEENIAPEVVVSLASQPEPFTGRSHSHTPIRSPSESSARNSIHTPRFLSIDSDSNHLQLPLNYNEVSSNHSGSDSSNHLRSVRSKNLPGSRGSRSSSVRSRSKSFSRTMDSLKGFLKGTIKTSNEDFQLPLSKNYYRSRSIESGEYKLKLELEGKKEEDVWFPINYSLTKKDSNNNINYAEIKAFCNEKNDEFNELQLSPTEKNPTKSILLTEIRNGSESSKDVEFEGMDINFGGDNGLQNRFTFFRTEHETIYAQDFPSLVEEGHSFKELFNDETKTWWLDCLNPTESEIHMLSNAFGIHPLTREDIETQEKREKFESFKSYYFIVFNTINTNESSDEYLEPITFYMILFKSGVLTFHTSPINHPLNVRKRIKKLDGYINITSDWICYALIDNITDSFAPIVQTLEFDAHSSEDNIAISRDLDYRNMIRNVGVSRRKVMKITRYLFGKAEVIKMFTNRYNNTNEDIVLYLSDIQDHITAMSNNLISYEKLLSRSTSNYLTQIKVESFNAIDEITKMFSKVTLIGIILIPLNVFTGLFGMNVKVPGDGKTDFHWFIGICCLLICLCLGGFFGGSFWMRKMYPDEEPEAEQGIQRRRKRSISCFKRSRDM